ncbi:MAG TPA: helix-turn-helix domain-containing protein [Tepidiformaceae bacterium]|nr:helix-turn-helix domain-containing protein [Tepidiformaceae bacterium]
MTDREEQADGADGAGSLGRASERFLAEFGMECADAAAAMGAEHISVDLQFLVFLERYARFGYFHFGPISIDVGLIRDIVERTHGGRGTTRAVMDDGIVRFTRMLTSETSRRGGRRIDELAYLLAFMRWREGLPGKVFGELGVSPEQVEAFARLGHQPAPDTPEKLYSPEDAADYLGVHVQTVRAWIRSGRLRASRLAGQRALRIRATDLESVLEPLGLEDA